MAAKFESGQDVIWQGQTVMFECHGPMIGEDCTILIGPEGKRVRKMVKVAELQEIPKDADRKA
jgi:hypothetical protein